MHRYSHTALVSTHLSPPQDLRRPGSQGLLTAYFRRYCEQAGMEEVPITSITVGRNLTLGDGYVVRRLKRFQMDKMQQVCHYF